MSVDLAMSALGRAGAAKSPWSKGPHAATRAAKASYARMQRPSAPTRHGGSGLPPAPGTFIHPVGRCYALEVTHVWTDDRSLPRVRCRRWGWKDGRVFDDGHRSDDHMEDLRYRGPGCWTSPPWHQGDLYGLELWRAVPGPSGQKDLFGGAP